MNPGGSIYLILNADSAVTALVGDRIKPVIAPETTSYPYVVYSQLNELREASKDGPGTNDLYSFDVEIFAQTDSEAYAIAEAAQNALDWFSGSIGTHNVNRIHKTDQNDNRFEEQKEVFQITQTYTIRIS